MSRSRCRTGESPRAITKRRPGSYAPDWLVERRRRAEADLTSVVATCYLLGVSTRRMEKLVESLGITRLSKSRVSEMARDLDEQVEAFRSRPLEGRYPYVFVDAKVEKVRDGGRVARKCVVIAHAVHETGRREIIGLDVGEAETEAFWREFLRSLVKRGLVGVQLAILPRLAADTAFALPVAAVYGVFNSLMPGFLAGTMHETSYAVAGAVAFSAFAAGAVAQIALGAASTATTLKMSVPVLFAGLTLFTAGMWLPSLPVFVIGGIVTGAGGGLVFRGSLVAAASTAPPGSRAEVLAGFFLGAYIGLSAPVIALGVATEYVAARDVMLVFVVLAGIAIAAGARAVLHHHSDHR